MEPDLGGNKVKVRYLGAESNLHSVWDSMVIEWGPPTVEEYATRLLDYELRGRPIAELQTGTPVDWINESHYAAVKYGYDIGNGNIGSDYAHHNIGIVYDAPARRPETAQGAEDALGAVPSGGRLRRDPPRSSGSAITSFR
jgi:hypothetical protein